MMTQKRLQTLLFGLLVLLLTASAGSAQSEADAASELSLEVLDAPVTSTAAPSIQLSYLRQDAYTIQPNSILAIRYKCPTGQRIVGGGWSISADCPTGCAAGGRINSNGPPRDATNAWETIVTNFGTRTLIGNFYRLCAID